jgi:cell division control protein 6
VDVNGVCNQNSEPATTPRLSQRRVTDFLKEHRDNGLIELTRTGGGPGQGSYYECHLTEKEDIVFKTLCEDDRLNEMSTEIVDTATNR